MFYYYIIHFEIIQLVSWKQLDNIISVLYVKYSDLNVKKKYLLWLQKIFEILNNMQLN